MTSLPVGPDIIILKSGSQWEYTKKWVLKVGTHHCSLAMCKYVNMVEVEVLFSEYSLQQWFPKYFDLAASLTYWATGRTFIYLC